MEKETVTVIKAFASYEVGDRIELDPVRLGRAERKRRIKRDVSNKVDPRRINKVPPKPSMMSSSAPRKNRKNKKSDAPPAHRPDGPTEDKRGRTPATKPVGPDLTRPIRPDEDKKEDQAPPAVIADTVRIVEADTAGWYHVVYRGTTIMREGRDGRSYPRNFRQAEAEKEAARLRRAEEAAQ